MDNEKLSKKTRKPCRAGRRRRHQHHHHHHQDTTAQCVNIHDTIFLFREQVQQQQLEINKLKEQINKLYELPDKLYDALDLVASGCGAMQNRLGEIHQQHPGAGERYKGL